MLQKLSGKFFPALRHSAEDQALVRLATQRLKALGMTYLRTAKVIRNIPGCTITVQPKGVTFICAVHKQDDSPEQLGTHLANVCFGSYSDVKIKWQ